MDHEPDLWTECGENRWALVSGHPRRLCLVQRSLSMSKFWLVGERYSVSVGASELARIKAGGVGKLLVAVPLQLDAAFHLYKYFKIASVLRGLHGRG